MQFEFQSVYDFKIYIIYKKIKDIFFYTFLGRQFYILYTNHFRIRIEKFSFNFYSLFQFQFFIYMHMYYVEIEVEREIEILCFVTASKN